MRLPKLTAGFFFLLFCLPCLAANNTDIAFPSSPTYDTIKYQGYRLDITSVEVLKKTDDWVKVRFTVVNSGRFDVDFSKEGTEHWVQVNFDHSIFEAKMGGLRENIRQELLRQRFSLQAGKVMEAIELKVSVILNQPSPKSKEVASGKAKEEEVVSFSAKGGSGELAAPDIEALKKQQEECPDIAFSALKIVSQDEHWATLEYTLVNHGKGVFHLQAESKNKEPLLALRAYISGVPTLSRGALPIGGQFISELANLAPGQSYTGQLRLDVRKKTRYQKSLILSLEPVQVISECDRVNNVSAVILD